MSLQPLIDNGQMLPSLGGSLFCVVDDREQVDRCATALNTAGHGDNEITLLHGEDGLNLVKRFEESTSYLSDAPEQLFCRDKSVLVQGKHVLAINVGSNTKAREVADLVRPHGAHGFMHFGMFVDTRFD